MSEPDSGGAPGAPWPRASYGEVFGPSGGRSFTSRRASEILGITDRRVRQLSARLGGEKVVLQGREHVFVAADDVRRAAEAKDRWPPHPHVDIPAAADVGALTELLIRQGHDLEQSRAALREAQEQLRSMRETNDRLRKLTGTLQADRRDLTAAVARLAAVAERADTDGGVDVEDA